MPSKKVFGFLNQEIIWQHGAPFFHALVIDVVGHDLLRGGREPYGWRMHFLSRLLFPTFVSSTPRLSATVPLYTQPGGRWTAGPLWVTTLVTHFRPKTFPHIDVSFSPGLRTT